MVKVDLLPARIFDHPIYSGWPVVFCLENDPKDLILLDYKSLKERMKRPGKFIRNVPLKNPVLLNINYSMKFSPFDIIGLEKINERADVIKNNPEFIERCKKAIIEINDEKSKLSNEDSIMLTTLIINFIAGNLLRMTVMKVNL